MLGTRTFVFCIFVLSLNCIIWTFPPCDICKWDGHNHHEAQFWSTYQLQCVSIFYMARSHHSLQIGENHTVPNIIIAAGKGCSTSYTSRTIVNLETAEVNNICRPGEPDTSALQGTPDKSCNFKSRRIDIEHCFSVLLCTLQLQVLMVQAHFTYSHFTYSHSPTLSFHSPTLSFRLLSFHLLSFHLLSFAY